MQSNLGNDLDYTEACHHGCLEDHKELTHQLKVKTQIKFETGKDGNDFSQDKAYGNDEAITVKEHIPSLLGCGTHSDDMKQDQNDPIQLSSLNQKPLSFEKGQIKSPEPLLSLLTQQVFHKTLNPSQKVTEDTCELVCPPAPRL